MDTHIKDFYCQFSGDVPQGNFHAVIALHETNDMPWESIVEKAPTMPKGWYELSRLKIKDRIEFTRDFWLATLPYHPQFDSFLTNFFELLDDIGIFITQKRSEDLFKPHLVYSLSKNKSIYRGEPPISEAALSNLQKFWRNSYSQRLCFLSTNP